MKSFYGNSSIFLLFVLLSVTVSPASGKLSALDTRQRATGSNNAVMTLKPITHHLSFSAKSTTSLHFRGGFSYELVHNWWISKVSCLQTDINYLKLLKCFGNIFTTMFFMNYYVSCKFLNEILWDVSWGTRHLYYIILHLIYWCLLVYYVWLKAFLPNTYTRGFS